MKRLMKVVALTLAVALFASCDDDEDDPVVNTIEASYAGEASELSSVQVITEDGVLAGFVISISETEYEAQGSETYIWDETSEGTPIVYHVWVYLDETQAAWYDWEYVSLTEAAGEIDEVSVWVQAKQSEDESDEDGMTICMILVMDLSGGYVTWWLDTDTVSFDVEDEEAAKTTSYTITVSYSEGSFIYEVEQ